MPVAPDLGVFERNKSFNDYQRANEEFAQRKMLQQAQIAQANAAVEKANQFDIGKVGEQAFIKASQGLPLEPIEASALQYLDAKSPTAVFNPVTGVMEQKPSLLQRAGIKGGQAMPMSQKQAAQLIDVFEPQNAFDAKFEAQLQAAAGNPKLQQSIRQEYAKAKTSMTDAESKAAGFSERMLQSEPSIEANKAAAMSMMEKVKASTPLIGNYLVSPEYQQFDQAQRDFINAQLRRESGAVINPDEFDNARRQYFPQPGDSPQVLEQKRLNRQAAIEAMGMSAGAAYSPPAKPVVLSTDKPKLKDSDVAQSLINAKKAIAKNPNNRDAIIQRLIDNGIDPSKAGL